MPKTAIASDDGDWKKFLGLIGVAGACWTLYQAANGKKVTPLHVASALLTIFFFFD
jgi:hypothetical protein